MPEQPLQWQVQLPEELPTSFIQTVKRNASLSDGRYGAQLLWQRGIRDPEQLAGFLNPDFYQPASPFAFGQEMYWAVERLQQARETGEVIAIWGDFDADGITATSILWEGLGQFFQRQEESGVSFFNSNLPKKNGNGQLEIFAQPTPTKYKLLYYIPNRLTESHGLNKQGIDKLAQAGANLIVTCDTGSTNLQEIEYAKQLGIDIIVTDHHTLLPERPPVTAIINPRYLPPDHQMFHLSGVAVAYKLVEALYKTLPDVPKQPLEYLLDLVAIGLIADLVQLSGDCRYLAQRGIERLQQQALPGKTKERWYRPGVARLLEFCNRSGDRPTDISFGLGPRINAVSRIHGDARFCVELLTSRDEKRCHQLALETELANTRRKSLQKDVAQQVKQKLSQLDLSTTSVIVLTDSQWAVGVLGLVAGEVAQEYGRPTILLSTEINSEDVASSTQNPESTIARGSARSFNNVDLYQLVKSQAHLLERFGGHPFAAGLSILVENIPLFTEAINQQLRQLSLSSGVLMTPTIQADLICTVQELGKDLFRELKLLEPCGMGNPVPKLLIQNCWFKNVYNRNIQDFKGRKIQYIKTEFEIWDNSTDTGFSGIWWGHYKDEVPPGRCDAIVELDYNNYKKRSEVRLIAVRPIVQDALVKNRVTSQLEILDWRSGDTIQKALLTEAVLPMRESPLNWDELQLWCRRASQTHQKLAIAYPPPEEVSAIQIWQKLVGIAKYLSRTGESATLAQVHEKLKLSSRTLQLGLQTLSQIGFQVTFVGAVTPGYSTIEITWLTTSVAEAEISAAIEKFLAVVQEEQFYRRYFYLVPLSTIEAMSSTKVCHIPG